MDNNFFNSVEFAGSFVTVNSMPSHNSYEYAFIGRSNVGKSSLINYLTGRKSIAKTSKKPGKTQLINLFKIDYNWYFVDLPGYGYASTSKTKRNQWKKMIYDYLEKRQNLVNCFVLLDTRLDLQQIDKDFIDWLGSKNIPFSIVFTKIDALKQNQKNKNIAKIKSKLLENWDFLPGAFEVSSVKKYGGDKLINYMLNINDELENQRKK